jgi:hypothetical protein
VISLLITTVQKKGTCLVTSIAATFYFNVSRSFYQNE